ncbi:MAG: hypothetical protein IPM85_02125 [Chitinophagaceae bacterium]|nr:hypothetical protein [Chitinophagaceae bacterium]
MNCHYGALFTDNQFHNAGFSGNDAGRYKVSHKGGDVGKFKTPSLRDVMKTGPWMHDGAQADMGKIIESFDKGAMSFNTDKLIRPLGLSRKEKEDLLAFMNAISAPPVEFIKPVIPD